VSVYGLGANPFGSRADEDTSIRIIHHALDHGVNLIDTANSYTDGHSERIIGKALQGRREQAVLATKCGWPLGEGPNEGGSSRGHIMREIDRSLRRLETDYVDLYQIHQFDPETPLDETLRALDDLVRGGKVRYIGCSNYAAWQLCKALWMSDRYGVARFDSAQPRYSPADRRIETELVPACLDQGVGLLVYFPLDGGILTGKYQLGAPPPPTSRAVTQPRFAQNVTDQKLRLAEDMARIAAEANVTLAQLTLAWVMHRPGVTSALIGVTRIAQQEENLRAVEITLDVATVERVTELSREFVAF